MSHHREDSNLTFIQEIEKYEYLYNFNMPEYSRKDMTERAWVKVAKKMGITVGECKEKWRNIRSAYLRSLKCVIGKSKRPYYLHEELKFLLPFTRTYLNTTTYTMPESSDNQNILEQETDDLEENNFESQDESIIVPSGARITTTGFIPSSPPVSETQTYANEGNTEPSHRGRRKRHRSEVERTLLKYLTYKKHKATKESRNPPHKPIQHFFLSLMPDIETMTEGQMRRFKIEVMLLIDRIKSNKEE